MARENGSAEEQKANRCAISYKDITEANKYLEAYLELDSKDQSSGTSEFYEAKQGLLMAAIVCYSRPFKPSRSDGIAAKTITIDLKDVLDNNQPLLDLHDSIINLRDQAVAHSDWELRSTELIKVNEKSILRRDSVVNFTSVEGEICSFMKLCEIIASYCLHSHYDLINKL